MDVADLGASNSLSDRTTELLEISPEISELISQGASIAELVRVAKKQGHIALSEEMIAIQQQ